MLQLAYLASFCILVCVGGGVGPCFFLVTFELFREHYCLNRIARQLCNDFYRLQTMVINHIFFTPFGSET